MKAYLFDFDGTLVDTMEGFADIAGEVIHKFHNDMSYKDARRRYLETSGVPFHQQLEIIFPNDADNKEIVSIFEERKQEGFFLAEFSQDVKDAINGLRARGDYAGVSSNNFQDLIEKFVSTRDLEFSVIMGYRSEEFQKGKDHFDYFISEFDIAREDLTFVGDSIKDAEKARDNNIAFIGVKGVFSQGDFDSVIPNARCVDSLKEILDI